MKFALYSTSGGNYQTYETVKKAIVTKVSSQVTKYNKDIVTAIVVMGSISCVVIYKVILV